MHIQYYGLSCVKLTTKPGGRGANDVTIVVNPFARTADLTPPQLANVDIVMAAGAGEMYYSDTAQKAAEAGDVISVTMPGEYAIHGTQIVGMGAAVTADGAPATFYVLESEGLKVSVITATDQMPSAKQFEEMNGTHILIIAIGGEGSVLDGMQAAEIAKKVEPSYVIPVHYALPKNKTTKSLATTEEFCGKIGKCPKEIVPKIVLKDKDCETATLEVVLMTP